MRPVSPLLRMRACCGVLLGVLLCGQVAPARAGALPDAERGVEAITPLTVALEAALQGVPCQADLACAEDYVNWGGIAAARPGVAPEQQRRYHLAAAAWAELVPYYDDAASHLEAALKAVPGEEDPAIRRHADELRAVWAPYRQGHVEYNEHRYEDALATWRRLVDAHPGFTALAMLGEVRVLAAAKRHDEAWPLLRKAAAGYPGTRWGSQAQETLGGWLMGEHRYEEALSVFEDLIKNYGDERGRKAIHLAVARCYLGLRRPTEALAALREARQALAGNDNAGGNTQRFRREIMRQVSAFEIKARKLVKEAAPQTKERPAR